MSHIANDTYVEHMREVGQQALAQQDVDMIKRIAQSLHRNGYTQQSTDLLEDMKESEWYCHNCESSGKDDDDRTCPYCQDTEETEINDRVIIGSNLYYE